MQAKVGAVRDGEVSELWKYLMINSALREVVFLSGPLSILIMFLVALTTGHRLDVVKLFRMIGFINMLRLPINLMGQALKQATDAMVSCERMEQFLLLPTVTTREHGAGEEAAISIEGATFSWDEHEEVDSALVPLSSAAYKFRLSDITFSARSGELIALVGSVGSGKTSLLSALLGEVTLLSGTFQTRGRVAYSAQVPWIQNMSVNTLALLLFTDTLAHRSTSSTILCSVTVVKRAMSSSSEDF